MILKKKIGISIITVALIIISILICIVIISNINKNDSSNYYITDELSSDDDIIIIKETLSDVTIKSDYYVIKNCINELYTQMNKLYIIKNDSDKYKFESETQSEVTEEKTNEELIADTKEEIYGILDEKYIEYAGINDGNLEEIFTLNNEVYTYIEEMYVIDQSESIETYFVNGIIYNKLNEEIQNFNFMVNIDKLNRTFKLYLTDYVEEFYSNIELGASINIVEMENITEIESNGFNEYEFTNILTDQHILYKFQDIKNNLLYNNLSIYNELNEEYREAKFENYEEFQEYCLNNKSKIESLSLYEYNKENLDDGTLYICKDSNNNYYMIKEKSLNDYEIMLDIYTIETNQVLESYELLSEIEKVQYSLQTVITSIKEMDFKYVYNKLDETFKTTNFENEEALENFIIENWSSEIEIEYTKVEETGGIYIIQAEITTENGDTITTQFIVQLLDGTDFVMSFNI